MKVPYTIALCFFIGDVYGSPRRALLWRQVDEPITSVPAPGNNTAVAPEEVTTSTAFATAMHTVTSCAPDVTDCPGSTANKTSLVSSASDALSLTSAIANPPPEATSGPSSITAQGVQPSAFPLTGGQPLGSTSRGGIFSIRPSAPISGSAPFPSGPFPSGPSSSGLPIPSAQPPLNVTFPGPGGPVSGLNGTIGTALAPLSSNSPTSASARPPPPPPPGNATASRLGQGAGAAQSLTPPAPFVNGTRTTLTVAATTVQTIVSCASTVSSCPAASDTAALSSALSALPSDAIQTVVVTSTIAEYTTICPVTAASAVSSSVLGSISSAITTVSGKLPQDRVRSMGQVVDGI